MFVCRLGLLAVQVAAWGHRRDQVDAIECKWNPGAFDSTALKLFRTDYPNGRNFLVTPSGDPAYTKHYGNIAVRICSPTELQPSK